MAIHMIFQGGPLVCFQTVRMSHLTQRRLLLKLPSWPWKLCRISLGQTGNGILNFRGYGARMLLLIWDVLSRSALPKMRQIIFGIQQGNAIHPQEPQGPESIYCWFFGCKCILSLSMYHLHLEVRLHRNFHYNQFLFLFSFTSSYNVHVMCH